MRKENNESIGQPYTQLTLTAERGRGWLEQVPPKKIGKVWLSLQYQRFRSNAEFPTAFAIKVAEYMEANTTTGTLWSPIKRGQVLAEMRGLKVAGFLGLCSAMEHIDGIDMFQLAKTVNYDLFFHQNGYFYPLSEGCLKIPVVNYEDPTLEVPLPKLLEREYQGRVYVPF